MARPPGEYTSQREVVYRLRYAIDTARRQPSSGAIGAVADITRRNPQAMRSAHVQHNLGGARMSWLEEQGLVGPLEENTDLSEIAGDRAIKGTATPEVIK